MQPISLYQRNNWLVSTIWLLSWHTREGVQTLATMLAGLSKMTVRQTSLKVQLFHLITRFYWNFMLTFRKMDRVWWWQPKHSQGGRHFETIRWRWDSLHEIVYEPLHTDYEQILSPTILSTQVTGTWLISACTKLVWLSLRVRGLLPILVLHFSCREWLSLFLCCMSDCVNYFSSWKSGYCRIIFNAFVHLDMYF